MNFDEFVPPGMSFEPTHHSFNEIGILREGEKETRVLVIRDGQLSTTGPKNGIKSLYAYAFGEAVKELRR